MRLSEESRAILSGSARQQLFSRNRWLQIKCPSKPAYFTRLSYVPGPMGLNDPGGQQFPVVTKASPALSTTMFWPRKAFPQNCEIGTA
jgi:hypothetical protein